MDGYYSRLSLPPPPPPTVTVNPATYCILYHDDGGMDVKLMALWTISLPLPPPPPSTEIIYTEINYDDPILCVDI